MEAGEAHLNQVFGEEPREAAALARRGAVEAWLQNYCSAARKLSRLADKDPTCLDFLLTLIPVNQRKHVAQVNQYRFHTIFDHLCKA